MTTIVLGFHKFQEKSGIKQTQSKLILKVKTHWRKAKKSNCLKKRKTTDEAAQGKTKLDPYPISSIKNKFQINQNNYIIFKKLDY